MFYQHLLYLKKRTLLFTPSPLVYGLYACENVDNCERPLTSFLIKRVENSHQQIDEHRKIKWYAVPQEHVTTEPKQ